ncbi:MAG: hypothetical protein HWN80_14280 [Candidatus Lokiarchaeota archaeon]|nr:hypothetical protein [Candidatus Lokiarchaeota archaeon]
MPDKYNVDMTLGELLEDEVSGKYLRENLTELVENPQTQMAMGFSLREIQGYVESMAPGRFSEEKLEEIDAALKAL